MEFVPAVYTKMTAALQETLTQTVETFTDFMSDVAIIVWLIDRPRRNLVVKSQLNAGEGLENQFKLAIDVKDFVVQAFKEQKSQYGDNLSKVIAPPSKEYAKERNWKSGFAVPLQTSSACFGVLSVYRIGQRGINNKERAQIGSVARLATAALQS